jgi:predicted permease
MTAPRRPLAVRVYGALVRRLPADLGPAHGAAAEDTFLDLYRETRACRGRFGALTLWLRSVAMLLACVLDGGSGGRRRTGAAPSRIAAHLARDARYACRALLAAPGFALTAILIVGIGIGATTTIFSVVDTVVLRPLPYPDAGRLIYFDNGEHGFPSFLAWRELDAFDAMAAARDRRVDLLEQGPPQRLNAAPVSAGFFPMFGAAPAVGRLLDEEDIRRGRAVTVLSDGVWRRLWGADPGIVGRTIVLDGAPVEVVGVVAPAFAPPQIQSGAEVDFWLPLLEPPGLVEDHTRYVLSVVGRLRPGVAIEAAQAEVDAQRTEFARLHPRQYGTRDGGVDRVPLFTLHEAMVGEIAPTLGLLLGAVGLMLLIACANVASLLLARGMSRSRELALRKALGASGRRLAALVLTESALLAVAGGVLGVALTYGGVAAFRALNPGGIPRIDRLAVDVRVLGFALALSLATGLVFGLLPAVQARYARITDTLKMGASSVTASRSGRRMRHALVVAELALAIVLLSGAGLLFRSFVGMVNVDPEFTTTDLHVVPLSLTTGYERPEGRDLTDPAASSPRVLFAANLLDALDDRPGIDAAAAGWTVPFRFVGRSRCCWRTPIGGDPALANADDPFVSIVHPVTRGYFDALGVPMQAGREFTIADEASRASVAVLNAPAALGLFGSVDIIGRTIALGEQALTVVGVVEGVHHWGLDQRIEEGVYVPYATFGGDIGDLHVLVRSGLSPAAVAAAAREVIGALDPALPIGPIETIEDRISRSVARPAFLATLFGTFAGIALLLAGAGLYGSMLYAVGQRRREMGIRIALGADAGRVMRLVLRGGLAMTAIGVVLGLVAARATTHLLAALIWGVEPTDPLTFVGVAGVLGLTALLACLVPAWHAARTDPLETLRT